MRNAFRKIEEYYGNENKRDKMRTLGFYVYLLNICDERNSRNIHITNDDIAEQIGHGATSRTRKALEDMKLIKTCRTRKKTGGFGKVHIQVDQNAGIYAQKHGVLPAKPVNTSTLSNNPLWQ